MHYITKFDTAKRWFLFEGEVIVTYPEHMLFGISVVYGSWAGPALGRVTEAAVKVRQHALPVWRSTLAHLQNSAHG